MFKGKRREKWRNLSFTHTHLQTQTNTLTYIRFTHTHFLCGRGDKEVRGVH